MGRTTTRLRAVIGLGLAQLRYTPVRTTLAVLAIAFAVLTTTLLASIGVGAVAFGQEQFDAAGRDLWITGGQLRLQAGPTPFENKVLGAHEVSRDIERHEQVVTAAPISLEAVYVGTEPSDRRLVTGIGIENTHGTISVSQGAGFSKGDVHYANGSYTGPMTGEVIIGPRTASLFDVSVGDTLYVSASEAGEPRSFRIVGVSSDFTRFLGTPTVAIHLSELQEITGTTGTDPATLLAVRLEDSADPSVVKADLERQYPEYDIRTNREQLEVILGENAVALVGGSVLIGLAVLASLALTVNMLALVVYQQRRELAALQAIGLSRGTLIGVVASEGVLLGLGGATLGLLATPPLVLALNRLAATLVGSESLLRIPSFVFFVGAGIALGIGTGAAVVAGRQIARLSPLSHLQ
jgi:putative ABC transport system permease protein